MVEQQHFPFDPAVHHQPPPVVPIRDGLAAPARPAPSPVPSSRSPEAAQWRPQEPVPQVTPQYIATARAISQILATRVLLLIAVITASGIWSYTIYDPEQLRIIAAGAFSLVGVAPLIWLFAKKG
jgi:hypothetical protein